MNTTWRREKIKNAGGCPCTIKKYHFKIIEKWEIIGDYIFSEHIMNTQRNSEQKQKHSKKYMCFINELDITSQHITVPANKYLLLLE